MTSIYEMPASEYNTKLAELLKNMPEFKQPEWSLFVKTGISKQRPPVEDDFWYKRAAGILRQIYIKRVSGVNRLRTRYGSKLNRGMKPERFRKASGKIIRTILQQADAAGFLEKYNEPGKRAGRILTEKGKEFLDSVGSESKPVSISPKEVNESTEQSDKEVEDTKTEEKEE
tara:strand:- start:241 stop:756 length:516 start_codon:yes stop_codon:yes gene_type:complete